jgi:hypothetical protein
LRDIDASNLRVPRSPSRKLMPFAIDLSIPGSGLTYSANYSVYHASLRECSHVLCWRIHYTSSVHVSIRSGNVGWRWFFFLWL